MLSAQSPPRSIQPPQITARISTAERLCKSAYGLAGTSIWLYIRFSMTLNPNTIIVLEQFLSQQSGYPVQIAKATRLEGTAHDNLLLDTTTEQSAFLLRIGIDGPGPLSKLDVAAEFNLLQVLKDSNSKSSVPLWLCTDVSLIGQVFAIYESAELWADATGSFEESPTDLALLLAQLHTQVDINYLQSATEQGIDPESETPPEIALLQKMFYASHSFNPAYEWALRRLKQNVPASSDTVLTHGDFHPGNICVDHNKTYFLTDWDCVGPGDPVMDIGILLSYVGRFGEQQSENESISRDMLLQMYSEAGGGAIDPPALRYWEIYAHVRRGLKKPTCREQASVQSIPTAGKFSSRQTSTQARIRVHATPGRRSDLVMSRCSSNARHT